MTPDDRDWDGLRIFWQNTRHIYWPMLTSGDYDMTASMARVCRDILPICKERAMVRENNPGMLLYEGIGVGGDTVFGNSVPAHLTEHRGGMTDVAILLADIYDHTRDEAFFTDTYLPWADAVVTFFEKKFPNRDANGKMLISPSAAVETYKNSTNPATEVGPLRRILSDLLRLDPGTLTPAQRTRYQALARHHARAAAENPAQPADARRLSNRRRGALPRRDPGALHHLAIARSRTRPSLAARRRSPRPRQPDV